MRKSILFKDGNSMEIKLIRKAYMMLLAYMADHECVYEDCEECAVLTELEKVIVDNA